MSDSGTTGFHYTVMYESRAVGRNPLPSPKRWQEPGLSRWTVRWPGGSGSGVCPVCTRHTEPIVGRKQDTGRRCQTKRMVWSCLHGCTWLSVPTWGRRVVDTSAVLTSDAIWHYWTWSDLISGQIRSDVPQRGQIRSDLDQIRSNQDQVGSGQIRIRSDPIKIRSDQVRSDQIQWDQIRSGPMSKDLTWSWPDLTWSRVISMKISKVLWRFWENFQNFWKFCQILKFIPKKGKYFCMLDQIRSGQVRKYQVKMDLTSGQIRSNRIRSV